MKSLTDDLMERVTIDVGGAGEMSGMNRSSMPGSMTNRQVAEGMIAGAAKGVLSVGAMGGIAKMAGVPTSIVTKALMPVAMRKGLMGLITGPLKGQNWMRDAGLVGKFADTGQAIASILGQAAPLSSLVTTIVKPIAALMGDTLGDILGMREGEAYRDALGSNEALAETLKAAETNPHLATELQLEGLSGLLLGGEEQQEVEAENKGSWLGDIAADMLNSVFGEIDTTDLEEDAPSEAFERFENTVASGAFGFSAAELERGTIRGSSFGFSGGSGGWGSGGGGGGWAGGGMSTGADAGSGGSSFA